MIISLMLALVFHQRFSPVLSRVYTKQLDIFYNYERIQSRMYNVLMPKGFGFLKDAEMHFKMTCPIDVSCLLM